MKKTVGYDELDHVYVYSGWNERYIVRGDKLPGEVIIDNYKDASTYSAGFLWFPLKFLDEVTIINPIRDSWALEEADIEMAVNQLLYQYECVKGWFKSKMEDV